MRELLVSYDFPIKSDFDPAGALFECFLRAK